MKEEVRLKYAKEIINTYQYPLPLHMHLKQFFRQRKQFGSRDRKFYTSVAYAYYRTGKNYVANKEEKIVLSYFLSESPDFEFLIHHLKDRVPEGIFQLPQKERIDYARENLNLDVKSLFPFKHTLSRGINFDEFKLSHLQQNYTWTRIKPGKLKEVKSELEKQGIPIAAEIEHSLAFFPNTKITDLKSYQNGLVEIQDLASQHTAKLMQPKAGEHWWDCCAGSGGKSLLLKEVEPRVVLFATDIRESILQNFNQRMERNKVKGYKTMVHDLEKQPYNPNQKFDGILVDAPCSGSGTWGRNPENLLSFNEKEVTGYKKRQLAILSAAAKNLKPGKPLIYITCSVFQEENEAVVDEFCANENFTSELVEKFLLYNLRADNIFAARLVKK